MNGNPPILRRYEKPRLSEKPGFQTCERRQAYAALRRTVRRATLRFAVVFFAAGFLAVVFFAAVFLATFFFVVFLAAGRTVFFTTFLRATLSLVLVAALRFAGALRLAVVFFAVFFFAVVLRAAGFLPAGRAAFFVAFLIVEKFPVKAGPSPAVGHFAKFG